MDLETTSVATPIQHAPPPRPRAFTEAQALELLKDRIRFGPVMTLKEFADGELSCNVYSKKVSMYTMRALMKGRLYPDLIDPETGKVFDYSKVPAAPPGYRAPLDADGNRIEKKHRQGPTNREKLVEFVATELLSRIDRRMVRNHAVTEKHVNDEVGRMFARIDELEKRLAAIEKEAREAIEELSQCSGVAS